MKTDTVIHDIRVLRFCSRCLKYWRLVYRPGVTCPCPVCWRETQDGGE